MSEEVKQYSIGVTLGLIIGLYIFSLAASIVYLLRRIIRQRTSLVILILSIIYSSLFVFLNIMAIFDLFFSNRKDFNKLFKFLKKFYLGFTIVDKALGFVLFNILINYLESGYFSKWNKLIDGIRRYIYSFIKLERYQKIILLAIILPIVAALLVLLVVYRKHFDLGYFPWEYTDILLDCYAIFEIYTGVGFFMYQLFKDCKKTRDENLTIRYCNYSRVKIMEKTELYLGKIKDSYDYLSELAPYFENNKSSPYYVYLQDQFNEIKETKNYYEKNKGSSLNNTKDIICNTTCSNVQINQNNNDGNCIQNLTKPKEQETQIEVNNKSNIGEKKPLSPEKEDYDTNEEIRKYRKAIRRIDKLKLLYKEIVKESKTPVKSCTFKLVIYFIAFSIAIVTDFVLPFAFDYQNDEEYYSNAPDLFDKNESDAINVVAGVLGMITCFFIVCPYTIITFYTTTRKRYISGDYLYNGQINDDISLMKHVQIVCGYSFALVYCNLYFWKSVDYKGKLGKPYFYDEIIIPDYVIKQGISIYMLIKIIIIIFSIIAHLKLADKFVYKNDLGEYNNLGDSHYYDNNRQFNNDLQKYNGIQKILEK